MKKYLYTALTACTLNLAACSVYDSASINQQAAQTYQETISKAKVDTTSRTAKRVQAIFQRMLPYANQANQTGHPFQWEMTVIRSDELNAWAMPGGKMAVYTGIVEKLKLNDDEIAAIVGHEMTHALLEHSKEEANRNAGIELGTQLGGNILQAATGIDPELLHLGIGLSTDLGLQKPFSRKAEREADLGGLKLMAQAGYDPRAAITVWEKMNQENNNNNVVNKVLSTHPTNNDRINLIRQQLPEVLPLYQRAKKP